MQTHDAPIGGPAATEVASDEVTSDEVTSDTADQNLDALFLSEEAAWPGYTAVTEKSDAFTPVQGGEAELDRMNEFILASIEMQREVYAFLGGYTPGYSDLEATAQQWWEALGGEISAALLDARGPGSLHQALLNAGTTSGRALKTAFNEINRPQKLQANAAHLAAQQSRWEQQSPVAPGERVYRPGLEALKRVARELKVDEKLIDAVQ